MSNKSENAVMEDIALQANVSPKQRLFMLFFIGTLIDLVVLNIFAEFWDRVIVASFSVSLLVALVLQLLLKMTLKLEHKVATYFNAKGGAFNRFLRFLSAWLILFISKFMILGVINFFFSSYIAFLGPHHGILAFLVVVIVMVFAEEMLYRIYRSLS
jgi:hypothetical protein